MSHLWPSVIIIQSIAIIFKKYPDLLYWTSTISQSSKEFTCLKNQLGKTKFPQKKVKPKKDLFLFAWNIVINLSGSYSETAPPFIQFPRMKARLPLVEFDEQSVWDEIVELCSVQKKAKLLSRLHVLTPIWQVAAQRQVQFREDFGDENKLRRWNSGKEVDSRDGPSRKGSKRNLLPPFDSHKWLLSIEHQPKLSWCR